VHASAATFAATETGRFVVAIIETIVVGKFFAGSNVANRGDEDAFPFFVGLAVGIARMVHKHRHPVAIDHHLAIANAEQISERAAFVAGVAFGLGDALSRVFQDASTLGNIVKGEASSSVNVRGTNDETRQEEVLPVNLVCSITQLPVAQERYVARTPATRAWLRCQ